MSRRDGDGALGFRNLKKWQEDPSTERKRKAKAVRANGREIHAESHASEREIHEQDDQTIRRSDPEEERESNAPREIHAGKRPRKPKPAPLAPRDFVPAPRVVELWNLRVHPHGLSKVVSLPPKRKGHIESRMRAKDASGAVRDEAWLVALFQRVTASDFMRGTNDRGWIADIDFVFNETNIAKILEGKYDNRKGVTKLPARAEPQVARREIEAERNRLWMQEEKKRIAAILAKDAEDKAAQ